MRLRRIAYRPSARGDLRAIGRWFTVRVSREFATSYLQRIRGRIDTLSYGSERGRLRSDLRKGLRIVAIMKSITVAFVVTDDTVIILRVFYGGQDWERALSADGGQDD